MKTLHIYIRGEHYYIDEHGCIYGGTNSVTPGCESGHEWRFLGVSTHHWNNHIIYSFEDICKDPTLARGGYFWDVDHGTVRTWGGSYCGKVPRITSAWVE